MTAMPVTYYQAKCDTCGALYDGDDMGSAFEEPSDALETAEVSGWLRERTSLLTCPECLHCANCGEQPAWVGGTTVPRSTDEILCDECSYTPPPDNPPAPPRRAPLEVVR